MGNDDKIREHNDIRSTDTQSVEELHGIQQESEKQQLPEQKHIFGSASLRKTHKAVHNLPDPTNPPLGFDSQKAFNNVYPFVRIPYLQPKTKDDVISFGESEEVYLDPKTKKIPLNSIFFGDNLHVLRALPSNSIDLIYIDPPFFSGRVYNQLWGDDNEIRTFNDIWDDGLPSYLVWLNARLWEMRRVLKNTGSIYVHCDWHASHYIKAEMDKIFGYENFINEIIWCYETGGRSTKNYPKKHDSIFWYSKKNDNYSFYYEQISLPRDPSTMHESIFTDESGRKYQRNIKAGKEYRYYLDKGVLPNDWWTDVQAINPSAHERIGYPTQKPEELLERIIKASSNENDIVADFFMGGGTSCAVAMKFGRKFIGCDISRVAASVTLDRLVGLGEEITNQESSLSNLQKEEQRELVEPQKKQLGLMQMQKLPSIHLFYVGTYPMERFLDVDQKSFIEFILTCYGARIWTGSDGISGVMNAATTILVGPHDPKEDIKPDAIRIFIQETLKQRFNPELRMKLKIISWRFPKTVQKYCRDLEKYFEKQGVVVSLELIPINSEQFRHRITEQYAGKPITESEFLLKFIVSPAIGTIAVKKIGELEYEFTAEGAHSNNLDGILINCQWDFDYSEGRFSDKEYALMRDKVDNGPRKGMYQAVLAANKEFEKAGKYLVACRVQDNFGAEKIYKKEVEIS